MTLDGNMEQLLIKSSAPPPHLWVVCENAHTPAHLPHPSSMLNFASKEKSVQMFFLFGVGRKGSPGLSLSWLLNFLEAVHSGCLISVLAKVKLLPVGLLRPSDPEA